jgi:hypothetical protein
VIQLEAIMVCGSHLASRPGILVNGHARLVSLWRFANSPILGFSPSTTYRDTTAWAGRRHVELRDWQETHRIKELEHFRIEKAEQLYRDVLKLARRKSSLETRNWPKVVGKPVQPSIEYDFSSIIKELKNKLIFFFRVALRSLVL